MNTLIELKAKAFDLLIKREDVKSDYEKDINKINSELSTIHEKINELNLKKEK